MYIIGTALPKVNAGACNTDDSVKRVTRTFSQASLPARTYSNYPAVLGTLGPIT